MAKQSVKLNDFSGGINKSSAARDIEGNESEDIVNLSVERPGIIQMSPISRKSDKFDSSILAESKEEKDILESGFYVFNGQADNTDFLDEINNETNFESQAPISMVNYFQFKSPATLGNRANPNFNKNIMGSTNSPLSGQLIKLAVDSDISGGSPGWLTLDAASFNINTGASRIEFTTSTDIQAEGVQLPRANFYRQTFGLAVPVADNGTIVAGDAFRIKAKIWFDTTADNTIPFYFKVGGTESRAFYVSGTTKSLIYERDVVAADNTNLMIYNKSTTACTGDTEVYVTDIELNRLSTSLIEGPYVNWGIGNEFPKFARTMTSNSADSEWSRWEYDDSTTYPITVGEDLDFVKVVSDNHSNYMKIKLKNLLSGSGRGYLTDSLSYDDAGFNIHPDTWYVIKVKYKSNVSGFEKFGLAVGDNLNEWWLDRETTDDYGSFKFPFSKTSSNEHGVGYSQIRIKTEKIFSPTVLTDPAVGAAAYPGHRDLYTYLDSYIYFNSSDFIYSGGAWTEGNSTGTDANNLFLIWMSIEPDSNQTDIYQDSKFGDEYLYGLSTNFLANEGEKRYRNTLYSVRDNRWDSILGINGSTPPAISLSSRNNSESSSVPVGSAEWTSDGYTSALRYLINPDCNQRSTIYPSDLINRPTIVSNLLSDSYFIDGALRTVDTSFGNMTLGTWYGYISKEMYGGETQVRSKPAWTNPLSWYEAGWFTLPRFFNPPTSGWAYIHGAPSTDSASSSTINSEPVINGGIDTNGEITSEVTPVRIEYFGTSNANAAARFADASNWFPHSKIVNKDSGQSMETVPINGHDIPLTISINNVVDSSDTLLTNSNLDDFDASFKAKYNLGISYLYDGISNMEYELNTMQETAVTPVTYFPNAQILSNETGIVDWTDATKIQSIRIHWHHGSRFFKANPRLSGFCIYMRKDISSGEDQAEWGHLFEVNFLTGLYKYYGAESISEYSILGIRQTGASANAADYHEVTSQTDYACGYEFNDDSGDDTYRYQIADEMFLTKAHLIRFIPGSEITYRTRNTHASEDLQKIKWKTSVVGRDRLYVGNLALMSEDGATIKNIYPDRVIMSPKYKFDTLPVTNFTEIGSIGTGDEIILLKYYKGNLIVFKKKSVQVINGDLSAGQEVFHETTNNGITYASQAENVMDGVCWVNNNGLFFYDGDSISNIIEKDVTVAGTTLNIKRFTLDDWASYNWDNMNSFAVFDSKLNQLIMGTTNRRVANDDVTGIDEKKRQFIYDFTTKSMVILKGAFSEHEEAFSIPISSYQNHLRFQAEDGSFHYWDTSHKTTKYTDSILITKDIDLQDPGRRKKFYKMYITFKASKFPDIESYTDANLPFVYTPSNIKVYYALNGTRQWQDFDVSLSTNYDSTSGLTGIEGNFIGTDLVETFTPYSSGVGMGESVFAFASDTTDTIKKGFGLKVNGAVYPIIDVNEAGTEFYVFDSENNGGVIEGTSSGSPTGGDTIEIISNDWIIAELKPKTSDTDKNNFKSIQFKIEGNGSYIPSNFSINDITVIYREKSIN